MSAAEYYSNWGLGITLCTIAVTFITYLIIQRKVDDLQLHCLVMNTFAMIVIIEGFIFMITITAIHKFF